ncbi:MAG: undecaprenyl-diphosphatase UppP [Anaerolineales bacterium]|nr:undecaprenyl-diphosphatase UppP [Anaerolineales bacterium]
MDLFQALILGIVQGLTEYIPVSSSGHLVLVPWLLGWPDAPLPLKCWCSGNAGGVFIYFWQDIWEIVQGVLQGLFKRQPFGTFEARLGWLVVIATVPAVLFGLLFKDFFESFFSAPIYVGVLIGIASIILVIAERLGSRQRELESIGWLDAIVIGLWQVITLVPGVSRSGATITGGMVRGFNRPAAARFSFLMSIPALGGAGVVAMKDLLESGNLMAELPALTVGFVAAAISGYFCIRWLLAYLQSHSLYAFAVYRVILSIIVIIVALLRG